MSVAITWWGHASATVQFGGVRVLTDPVLTRRVAHLTRVGWPEPGPAALDADVVVVSHLHTDHLHLPSLRRIAARTRLVAPAGAAAVLRRQLPELSRRVEEVRPGEVVTIGDVEVRAVPAHHDGRRLPGSRIVGPALGFVLADGRHRIWFAGDTGLFAGMADIGPVDIAIVPVGGWGPTLGPEHLDPAQAAEAVGRVGARDAVPVHYGTLWPMGLRTVAPAQFARKCRAPGGEFALALARADPGARAHVVDPGGTVEVGR